MTQTARARENADFGEKPAKNLKNRLTRLSYLANF